MTELRTVWEQPQNMWFKSGLAHKRQQSGVLSCVLALHALPMADPEVLEGSSSEELLLPLYTKSGASFPDVLTKIEPCWKSGSAHHVKPSS